MLITELIDDLRARAENSGHVGHPNRDRRVKAVEIFCENIADRAHDRASHLIRRLGLNARHIDQTTHWNRADVTLIRTVENASTVIDDLRRSVALYLYASGVTVGDIANAYDRPRAAVTEWINQAADQLPGGLPELPDMNL